MSLFSTREVCEITGVTYRRLDYWVRMGYVTPEIRGAGSGRARGWSNENVDRVVEIRDAIDRAVALLHGAGIPDPPTVIGPHLAHAETTEGTSRCCHIDSPPHSRS